MPDEDSPVAVSIDTIHVDQAVVSAAPRKSTRQTLIELTPLLSVLITAAALVTTSVLQLWQTHSIAAQKVDEEWRTALAKISDDQDALVGTLEMQSFLDEERYRLRAGSIIAVKLPRISDKDEFDAAFAEMPNHIDNTNQVQLINIAKSLSNDLRDAYTTVMKTEPPGNLSDSSFEHFLVSPEDFISDGKRLDQLQSATWKLDSTTRGLQKIWTRKGMTTHLTPEKMDLSEIVFYGAEKPIDFTGVSFRGANLDHSEFVGRCIVKAPEADKINHCESGS